MTEAQKITRLRTGLTTTMEILRVLGGFDLVIQLAERTLAETKPGGPRRTHEQRWEKEPQEPGSKG